MRFVANPTSKGLIATQTKLWDCHTHLCQDLCPEFGEGGRLSDLKKNTLGAPKLFEMNELTNRVKVS